MLLGGVVFLISTSPKRRLVECPQLPRVQPRAFVAQYLAGADADLQVAGDSLLVEMVGLAGQLYLSVERLVADA